MHVDLYNNIYMYIYSYRSMWLTRYSICVNFSLVIIICLLCLYMPQNGLFLTKQLKGRSNNAGTATAERKILIVFVYYVLLAAISLLTFSLSIKSTDQFIDEVLKHFKCESWN